MSTTSSGLLEFVDRVYVFDSCFCTEIVADCLHQNFVHQVINSLHERFPESSILAFNFRQGEKTSVFAETLCEYDVTVLEYPRLYEGCPLLPLSLIQHFLCVCESWLACGNRQDVILLHCETGGWPLLAFVLASFLIFRKIYTGERRTLEFVHRGAPKGLLQLLSPLNPFPSQLRYLQYVARRNIISEWPPPERALLLDCVIFRAIPNFDSQHGCRPIIRIFGRNFSNTSGLSTEMLYSMSDKKKTLRHYRQAECGVIKIDIQCWVQGDVVLECVHQDFDSEKEVMMFRVMFNTAFIRSNILILNSDNLDILWEAKDHYPKGFKAEVLFGEVENALPQKAPTPILNGDETGGLPIEAFSRVQELFSGVDLGETGDDAALWLLKQLAAENDAKEVTGFRHKGSSYFNSPDSEEHADSSDEGFDLTLPSDPPSSVPHVSLLPPRPPPTPPINKLTLTAPLPPLPSFSDGDPLTTPYQPIIKTPPPPPPSPPPFWRSISPHSTQPPPPPPPLPPTHRSSSAAAPPPPPKANISNVPLPPRPPPLPPSSARLGAFPPPPPPLSKAPAPPPPPPSKTPGPPPPPVLGRGIGSSPPPLGAKGSNAQPPPPAGSGGASWGPGRGRGVSAPPKKTVLKPLHWSKVTRATKGSLWADAQKQENQTRDPEIDISELESLFSAASATTSKKSAGHPCSSVSKPENIHLVDLRRAYNSEIMLTNIKIPLPDLLSTVLALDSSALDIDQVEILIKLCPTKEEMELLRNYTGDKQKLGSSEQFFMELMKVPRIEAKLRVFGFKITFASQVEDLKGCLKTINAAANEVKESAKLHQIMQTILALGNALNQGTARGSAVGFKLDSLLKLSDTSAGNNKMTLIHYLCKLVGEIMPELLDFPKDLVHLEAASKIELKTLAEDMQAATKGLEKVEQELAVSEDDGDISQGFRKVLKEFYCLAQEEMKLLASSYSEVRKNADSLCQYFGEDPARCPFEQVTKILTLVKGSLCTDTQKQENQTPAPEIDTPKLETLFSAASDNTSKKSAGHPGFSISKPENIQLTPGPPPPLGEKRSNAPPPGPPPGPPPPPRVGKGRGTGLTPLHWSIVTRASDGTLWANIQKQENQRRAPEIDLPDLVSNFSEASHTTAKKRIGRVIKPEKVQLVDLQRAMNCEIMLTRIKIPFPDILSAVLALNSSALYDQVENLIQFYPTKEEMELLRDYKGDKEMLGNCEQYFLELMKVPRIEAKLRVFGYKITYASQVEDLKSCLNTIELAADEVKESASLHQIMLTILKLGNALNKGTARGSAVGFKLDSLSKLSVTRARNSNMTLMHYLCKLVGEKMPELLDFPKDLVHLEAASKIESKILAEEMQVVTNGLDMVEQELAASEDDGALSLGFPDAVKEFFYTAQEEVKLLASLYSEVGKNADSLCQYFGEDPAKCSFEQVTKILTSFMKTFIKSREENKKQAEAEKKKLEKEAIIKKSAT